MPTTALGGPLGEPTGELFHVFLSHAGEQKQGFVDFLAAEFQMRFPEVKVFLDEYALEVAGRAMDNIHAALQDAFVVVLVLSKDFISKKYPMEELHLLLERDRQRSGTRAKVLPVFYDVTTDDIGQKRREYAAATGDPQKHQWARDLELLGKITGIRPDQVAHARGTELVLKVIKETARLLFEARKLPMQKRMDLPPSLVALDAASDPLVALLTAEGSRKMVLLHGMVGSGKSTRARAVFNHLHALDPTVPCCFLNLGNKDRGLEEAQRQMLRELAFLPGNVGRGTLEAGRQLVADGLLRGTRVLLVVDNVWRDQLEQLLPRSGRDARSLMELLGEGSMVLVTSRDRTGARHFGGGALEEVQMGYLGEAEAWELFCKLMAEGGGPEARGVGEDLGDLSDAEPEPDLSDPEVEGVMRQVLERCGGLPLAIEERVKHLKEGPPPGDRPADGRAAMQAAYMYCRQGAREGLLDAIKSCWEGLSQPLEDDLLDVVWFFKGRPWEVVDRYCTNGALAQLEGVGWLRRCLSERSGTLRVGVHAAVEDCIQVDMQRKFEMWQELAVKDAEMEGAWVGVQMVGPGAMGAAGLERLSKREQLRVLQLDEMQLSDKDLKVPGQHVRWLGVAKVDTPDDLQLELSPLRLAAPAMVDLQHLSQLTQLQFPQQHGKKVHALWVSQCPHLRSMHVDNLTALELLRVKGCSALGEVHGCAGLSSLATLDLCGCTAQGAAASFQSATARPALILEPCCETCKLDAPRALDGLRTIRQLNLQHCNDLVALSCLQPLQALTRLQVQGCSCLQHLHLGSSIRQLLVKGCGALAAIRAPPLADTAGRDQGYRLQQVDIQGCPLLGELPDPQLLGSLTRLQLQGCDALARLQLGSSVKQLLVRDCRLLQAIQVPTAASPSGQRGCQLQVLEARGCPLLAELPDPQRLQRLASVKLVECPALRQVRLGASLEQLLVRGCPQLAGIQAPAGDAAAACVLQQLRVLDCRALEALPGLQLLGRLTQLEVVGCPALQRLQLGASLLRVVVRGCAELTQITGLDAPAAGLVESPSQQQQQQQQREVPTIQAAAPPQAMQLTSLRVLDCPQLGQLPCLRRLAGLQVLTYQLPDTARLVEWQRDNAPTACPCAMLHVVDRDLEEEDGGDELAGNGLVSRLRGLVLWASGIVGG